MSAFILEKHDSREATVSADRSEDTIRFLVGGTDDDDEVRTLVFATIPAFYRGLIFQDYRMTPRGAGVWEIESRYGMRVPRDFSQSGGPGSNGGGPGGGGDGGSGPNPGGGGQPGHPQSGNNHEVGFEIGSQSVKITQTLETTHIRWANPLEAAPLPDFGGAIGVNGDNVDGCEVDVPTLTWTEKHFFGPGVLSKNYRRILSGVANAPINGTPFRGFATGEVRFLGASGTIKDFEPLEITYKFAQSPNKTNLKVGDITDIIKGGWEYLWVRYEDRERQNRRVKVPVLVFVERVYEQSDYSLLRIGMD